MTAARYARAIEHTWSDLSGRSGVLSSRDWARISDWYARSIPLELVREVLASAFESKRRKHPPRSLAALGPAIDEAWRVVVQGRLATGAAPPEAARPPTDPRSVWRAAVARLDPDSALGRLLSDLVARLDAGERADTVERELERRIDEVAAPTALERARRAIDGRLAPFRERLAPPQFEATRRRALAEYLRREIGLPRLS